MRNIKMTIEYDGNRYLGWQRLGNSDKTIQGKIEQVLKQLTGESIEIIGSGRTDAGTHAKGQVANFKTGCTLSLMDMQHQLNHQLPKDIVVVTIDEVSERFHARYNAKTKQYSYYVWYQQIPTVFDRNYSFYYPAELDLKRMKEACLKFQGKHDFAGFSALKKTKKSTVRTIETISIDNKEGMLHFTFVGDGFLYKMIRIMVGTLLEIGTGERSIDSIEEILEQKVRSEAGMTVPAHGLFLDEVHY